MNQHSVPTVVWRYLPLLTALGLPLTAWTQEGPPPDHVVVVIEENHTYSEIVGNQAEAPYFNTVATSGALFSNSHAIEHPSQPNYLDLFSGANQGVVADTTSPLAPFITFNLAAGLHNAGHTFADFSESLPSVGFLGDTATTDPTQNQYQRKHNPVSNWQNDVNPTANQVSSATNQPFTAFPTSNFAALPTVSFVVPNEQHDMHDGTIAQADTWLSTNIESYREWAQTHNSLLIVTFDENDYENGNDPTGSAGNQILTIFSGQHVKQGTYDELITHYNVLQTLQDFYGTTHAGATGLADGSADPEITPITDVFDNVPEPGAFRLAGVAGVVLLGLPALGRWRRRRRARRVHKVHWTPYLTALLLAAGCFLPGLARATTVIAPNNLPDPNGPGELPAAQTYGDTPNLFPLFPGAGNALRYQQVYASAQFTTFTAGGEDITQIAFRVGVDAADRTDHGAFAATIPLIQIMLSTTGSAPDGLAANFAANEGADAVTVYGVPGTGAPLAVASAGAPLAGTSPAAFDITITLTSAFHYDPAKGNLLLELINYQGADSPTGIDLDGTFDDTDAVSRAYNFGDAAAAASSDSDTGGIVTQFTASPVPEPTAAALVTLTILLALALRQRSTRQSPATI